jgi:hypothetical protein
MDDAAVFVYVKHYLTPRGIAYFQHEWFPWVYSVISKQPGFISIAYTIEGACTNVSLHFKDSVTFEAWLAHPSHDRLVDDLDDYRDRDYWEAVRTDNEQAKVSQLQWMKIKPRKNAPRERNDESRRF